MEDTTCPLDHLMTPKAQQRVCQGVISPWSPYSNPYSRPRSPYSNPRSPPDNARGLGLNLTLEQDKQLPLYKRILAAAVECFCA